MADDSEELVSNLQEVQSSAGKTTETIPEDVLAYACYMLG